MAMQSLITEFLNYLRYEKFYSQCTIDSYREDLSLFCSWLEDSGDNKSLCEITIEDIRSWLECMMDKGNKVRTVKRRIATLRSFFHYYIQAGKIDKNPTKKIYIPKSGKPLPQFLREHELNDLFDREINEQSFCDVRTKMEIQLFYLTGIRLSELIGLNDADVNFEKNEIKVLGKGRKQRIIPFGEELKNELIKYIQYRDKYIDVKCKSLFVDDKGDRIKQYKVRYDVKKVLSSVCTLKKNTPHVLRHTFATSMLNNGTNIRNVQELLGHASAATTVIYTHTTFEQLKNTYNNAHPRVEHTDK